MSHEAIPIIGAYLEEGRKHPEGGKDFNDALDKRVQEIKNKSIEEKKAGHLRYRQNLLWAGIQSQEDFDKKCQEAVIDYENGNFFLERIGRYREIDVPLTMVLLHQRNEWIKEYDLKTIPEYILLDMALVSYFNFLRLNEAVNNMMSSLEYEFFALDAPRFESPRLWGGKPYGKKDDKAVAETLVYRLKESLQPVLDQFNRAFIRNLKALRDLKRGNIQLNIGNVAQMNIGDKQINVEKGT